MLIVSRGTINRRNHISREDGARIGSIVVYSRPGLWFSRRCVPRGTIVADASCSAGDQPRSCSARTHSSWALPEWGRSTWSNRSGKHPLEGGPEYCCLLPLGSVGHVSLCVAMCSTWNTCAGVRDVSATIRAASGCEPEGLFHVEQFSGNSTADRLFHVKHVASQNRIC